MPRLPKDKLGSQVDVSFILAMIDLEMAKVDRDMKNPYYKHLLLANENLVACYKMVFSHVLNDGELHKAGNCIDLMRDELMIDGFNTELSREGWVQRAHRGEG